MRRVLFEWHGIRIWSYPAFLYLGLVAGMFVQHAVALASGLDALGVYVATLLLLPVALVGARLLFVVSHWRTFRSEPRRIWRRSDGGLSMLGAVPCMLLASIPLLRALGVPFWSFWDATAFCILTGMAFTRVGCLLNGCCAGRVTDGALGIMLTDIHGVRARRIPMQLFEGATALLLLALAAAVRKDLTTPGALFLLTLGTYGTARAGLQRLRADPDRVGGVDVMFVISLLLVAASVVLIFWIG